MSKTIKISDNLYRTLTEVKHSTGHTSYDSALRDVFSRAGIEIAAESQPAESSSANSGD